MQTQCRMEDLTLWRNVLQRKCLKIYKRRKEDGQKKYQNRNKSKLACVSLCSGGRYWITLTRRTKTVMEMCLLLWQPCSHDNCFTGWQRRRHTHKSCWSCINAYKHTHVDMYNPSLSAWLSTFWTRKVSCPSFHVCSFSFNFRDCHKIPTSEMTTNI